jgi:hypothetical protein
MADIKDQLIKDSYNYVLQSDISTGVVYRIGGTIPVNPIFSSGITINDSFTYSNGTEQNGYALLTDGTGYAYWGPISGASPSSGVTSITVGNGLSANSSTGAVTIVFTGSTSGDYLPLSGGTVTGGTIFQNGLTATTISATTYYNLPVSAVTNGTGISASTINGTVTITNTSPDQTVTISGGTGITTGGTYPNFTLVNSAPDQTVTITGGTNIQISGTYPNFGVNFTGDTGTSGAYLPLSGGTVTGGTIFQSGLTTNTISATTYQNLPTDVYVTGGTYTNGEITFLNNTGGTFTVTGLPIGGPGGQIYYLNLSNSQPPYQEFSPSGTTNSQQTTAVTISNGVTITIASFQTPTGYPNASLIPAGYWSFYLHSFKQNSNASFDIFCEVYLRTTGGTETLLVTTDPAPVTTNSPNPSMQLTDGYYSGSSINTTDRIVVKVRATNTSNQSHSITLVTEGTQHYSYGITPFSDNSALTCGTLSGCSIIQTIQTDISNKFDKSGGTINGNLTVTGNTSLQGLTATTVSATTYQNLPVSAVTSGTGISASTSNGVVTITNTAPDQTVTISSGTDISVTGTYPNFTVEYTGTGGGGTTLIASNSCVIPADDITYYGATIGGWGFFNWDVNVKSVINPSLVNLGIPLPENLSVGDTISVCGIAFNNATEPDSDNFDVRLDFFQCTNYSIIPLGDVSYLYGTDGVVCFNLYIELDRNLSACNTFLLLGFTSTDSDATQIKISYSIKTPGTNR